MRDILIKEVVRVDPLKVFHFVKDLSQRSHLMCSVKKYILKNCTIFTGKHLRRSGTSKYLLG